MADISPDVLMSWFKRGLPVPAEEYDALNVTPYNVITRIVLPQVADLIVEYNEAFREYIALVRIEDPECKFAYYIVKQCASAMCARFEEICDVENICHIETIDELNAKHLEEINGLKAEIESYELKLDRRTVAITLLESQRESVINLNDVIKEQKKVILDLQMQVQASRISSTQLIDQLKTNNDRKRLIEEFIYNHEKYTEKWVISRTSEPYDTVYKRRFDKILDKLSYFGLKRSRLIYVNKDDNYKPIGVRPFNFQFE